MFSEVPSSAQVDRMVGQAEKSGELSELFSADPGPEGGIPVDVTADGNEGYCSSSALIDMDPA
jgi:hypothetical protein